MLLIAPSISCGPALPVLRERHDSPASGALFLSARVAVFGLPDKDAA
jgi:hypothetical protein